MLQPEAGARNQDQCDRADVMLVHRLLRRQAGEAVHVRSVWRTA